MNLNRSFCVLLSSFVLTQCDRLEKPHVDLEPPEILLPVEVRLLSPEKANELMRSTPDLQIIDCRQEHEFSGGHFPGAKHINYFRPDDIDGHLANVDPTKPCLVYCALGTRARVMAVKMHEAKFADIAVLDGGVFAWKKAGLAFPPTP